MIVLILDFTCYGKATEFYQVQKQTNVYGFLTQEQSLVLA